MADARKKKRKRLLVGITGAVGAGKSTVCRVFRDAGFPVLSADDFARAVTAPGSNAFEKIQDLFGAGSLTPTGELDRAFLRSKMLKDPSLRKQLEAITHPAIQKLSSHAAEALFDSGATIVFYEAPLLFEAGSDKRMDKVICVHAPESLLVDRVMLRDEVPKQEAERLLAAQMPQTEKMKRSDYLIENSGSELELAAAATRTLREIEKLND